MRASAAVVVVAAILASSAHGGSAPARHVQRVIHGDQMEPDALTPCDWFGEHLDLQIDGDIIAVCRDPASSSCESMCSHLGHSYASDDQCVIHEAKEPWRCEGNQQCFKCMTLPQLGELDAQGQALKDDASGCTTDADCSNGECCDTYKGACSAHSCLPALSGEACGGYFLQTIDVSSDCLKRIWQDVGCTNEGSIPGDSEHNDYWKLNDLQTVVADMKLYAAPGAPTWRRKKCYGGDESKWPDWCKHFSADHVGVSVQCLQQLWTSFAGCTNTAIVPDNYDGWWTKQKLSVVKKDMKLYAVRAVGSEPWRLQQCYGGFDGTSEACRDYLPETIQVSSACLQQIWTEIGCTNSVRSDGSPVIPEDSKTDDFWKTQDLQAVKADMLLYAAPGAPTWRREICFGEAQEPRDWCRDYAEDHVGVSVQCLQQLWTDSQCTNSAYIPDDYSGWWTKQKLSVVQEDMRKYADTSDPWRVQLCYGGYDTFSCQAPESECGGSSTASCDDCCYKPTEDNKCGECDGTSVGTCEGGDATCKNDLSDDNGLFDVFDNNRGHNVLKCAPEKLCSAPPKHEPDCKVVNEVEGWVIVGLQYQHYKEFKPLGEPKTVGRTDTAVRVEVMRGWVGPEVRAEGYNQPSPESILENVMLDVATLGIASLLSSTTIEGKFKQEAVEMGVLTAWLQPAEAYSAKPQAHRGLGAVSGGFMYKSDFYGTTAMEVEQQWGQCTEDSSVDLGATFYSADQVGENKLSYRPRVCFAAAGAGFPIFSFRAGGNRDHVTFGTQEAVPPTAWGNNILTFDFSEQVGRAANYGFTASLADTKVLSVSFEEITSQMYQLTPVRVDSAEFVNYTEEKQNRSWAVTATETEESTIESNFKSSDTFEWSVSSKFTVSLPIPDIKGATAGFENSLSMKASKTVEFSEGRTFKTTTSQTITRPFSVVVPAWSKVTSKAVWLKATVTVDGTMTLQTTYKDGRTEIRDQPVTFTGIFLMDMYQEDVQERLQPLPPLLA